MNNYNISIMKKTALLILACFLISALKISAQNPEQERLNSYKIGFFTKRLSLSAAEAEKFWPVYNEYQEQRNAIQKERIRLIRNFNQNQSTLNDAQLTEISDKLIGIVVTESDLAVSFHKKLKEVLSPAKVISFYQAETQFKAQLLNELQNRSQKNRPVQNRPLQQRRPGDL